MAQRVTVELSDDIDGTEAGRSPLLLVISCIPGLRLASVEAFEDGGLPGRRGAGR